MTQRGIPEERNVTPRHIPEERTPPVSVMFFPQREIPSFTPIQNNSRHYSSVCFNVYICRQQTTECRGLNTATTVCTCCSLSVATSARRQTATYPINVQTADSHLSYKCPDDPSPPYFPLFLLSPTYYIEQADAINHRFSSGIRLLTLPPSLTVKWQR